MNPIGLILVATTTALPAYQLATLPNVADQAALFSQYLGLAALILMAWGQIMATRLPGIETVFGGLDRIYVLHKWAGMTAMGAILLHDTIDADMRGQGRETALNELAETLGEVSLYGLLIMVVMSVATFIPYHLWKWTHKAMGVLFAAASLHFFLIMKPFAMSDAAGIYTGLFCLAGLAAYFWTLLPDRMRKSHEYTISDVERTGDSIAITMKPAGAGLKPRPGQFGVFRIIGSTMDEPHPFSFSRIGHDRTLRITAKALGDFTSRLEGAVAIGQMVRVQGPFGRFNLRSKRPQIWIAGGVGITPFLAGANALDDSAGPVELFYCVRSRINAPHMPELKALALTKPNLNLHVLESSAGRRLSADLLAETVGTRLADAKISFCGPSPLRQSLQTGLRRHGVTARNFQYEEFEFRTGVGLEPFARWLLKQTGTKALRLAMPGSRR